jgi:hypothetical protein
MLVFPHPARGLLAAERYLQGAAVSPVQRHEGQRRGAESPCYAAPGGTIQSTLLSDGPA